jgi:predicted Zn-dependent peptidase
MRRLGHVWTVLRRYESLEDDLRRVEALTIDDLKALIREFPLEPRTIAALRPKRA